MSSETLGVGFVGAGAATQAIHLPTLATLDDRFRVVHVMDVDEGVAATVAARCGARSTVDERAVLDDPAVDVVVICSPNDAHARQVVAACDAGKRAVLCEKPLAVSAAEAETIAASSRASGTSVIVGTMHAYDPACRAALDRWRALEDRPPATCQSSILLPSNDVYVDQATDFVAAARPAPSEARPDRQAVLRLALLGLTIHDIPLLRALRPSLGQLRMVRSVRPFGYSMVLAADDGVTTLSALMPGVWAPDWTLRAVGDRAQLRIAFPPSYVLAGGSRAEIVTPDATEVFESAESGYQAQWRQLHDVLADGAEPVVSLDDAIDDLRRALALADQIDEVLA